MEDGHAPTSAIDRPLAARLAALRLEQGWSLDMLAERSGVSRATLSRLERGQTSPTAAVLNRLCGAYGRTMSRLLAEVEADPPSLVRAADQPVWTDRPTGFRRRSVSPPAHGFLIELIEGRLPPGAVVAYDRPPVPGLEHHLWLATGRLDLAIGDDKHLLQPGDCLRYRLFGASRFTNPGLAEAIYSIAIGRP